MKLTLDDKEYHIIEIKIDNFYTENTCEIRIQLQDNKDIEILTINLNRTIDHFS